jgi:branched-chain amino acid transport system substrate-binding protein
MREKGLNVPFMGADGLDSSEFVNLAGDAAVDVIFTTTSVPASAFPRAAELQVQYEERFGEQFQSYAAYGYDAMNICLEGIARAVETAGGMPTRAEVAAEVRATADFDGITGMKTFNDIGDLTVAQYVVLRVTSADAEAWGENEVVQVLDIPAPTE